MRASTTSFGVVIVGIVALTTIAVTVKTSEASGERTYVGQENCMSSGCHAGAYSPTSDYQGAGPFRATLHQKIHLRPNPETVVIERYFSGDSTIRFFEPAAPPGMD